MDDKHAESQSAPPSPTVEATEPIRPTPVKAAGIPEELLKQALDLYNSLGEQDFTMDALARATGLSRATLYRQVGSREAILEALAEQGNLVGERKDIRERILGGARTVFSQQGLDRATMEDIAREAGVGVATLYRHFRDKESLALDFLNSQHMRRVAREVVSTPTGDLRRDLERLAEGMLSTMVRDQDVIRLILMQHLQGGPMLKRIRSLSPIRTLTLLAQLLAPHVESGRLKGADTETLAQTFSGLVMTFGLLGPIMLERPLPHPANAARHVTRIFLEGATSDAPGILEVFPTAPSPDSADNAGISNTSDSTNRTETVAAPAAHPGAQDGLTAEEASR